jgi:mRNA interferase MazF
LREWKPQTAAEARERIAELIELADHEVLDIARAPPNRRSSTCLMNPQAGEIWLGDPGLAAKTRPIVIVSRQDLDPPRSLVLYVPLTTQRRNSSYEAPPPRLSFLDRESVANVQGLGNLPSVRLERKIGKRHVGIGAIAAGRPVDAMGPGDRRGFPLPCPEDSGDSSADLGMR